jgi:hypothetical protein
MHVGDGLAQQRGDLVETGQLGLGGAEVTEEAVGVDSAQPAPEGGPGIAGLLGHRQDPLCQPEAIPHPVGRGSHHLPAAQRAHQRIGGARDLGQLH